MAIKYRTTTFAFPTSTADLEVSFGVVGESLKQVFFTFAKYTDGSFATGYSTGIVFGHGYSDGTNDRGLCISIKSDCLAFASRCSSSKSITAIKDTDGSLLFRAHVKTMTVGGGNDGCTLTIDTAAPAVGDQYVIIAFGIFGDWEANVGTISSGTVTCGFQPDIGGLANIGDGVVDDTSYTTYAGFSIGFFQRYPALTQCSRWWELQQIAGINRIWSYISTIAASTIVAQSGTPAVSADVTLTGFTSTGFECAPGYDAIYWAGRKTTPGPLDAGLVTALSATSVASQSFGTFRGLCSAAMGTIGKVAVIDTRSTANAAQCYGFSIVDDAGNDYCIVFKSDLSAATCKTQNRLADIQQVTVPLGQYAGDFTSFSDSGKLVWLPTVSGGTPYWSILGLGSMNAKLHTRAAGILRAAGRIR